VGFSPVASCVAKSDHTIVVSEGIAHVDDPAVKQLNESHWIIKSRFDDIKLALKSLLHTVRAQSLKPSVILGHVSVQPLTTPPVPSVVGVQLTQLEVKGS